MCKNIPSDTCGQLRLRAFWSEFSLSTWKNFASLSIQNAPNEDSAQNAQEHRLIKIFAWRTCPKVRFLTLRLKSSRCGSNLNWFLTRYVICDMIFLHTCSIENRQNACIPTDKCQQIVRVENCSPVNAIGENSRGREIFFSNSYPLPCKRLQKPVN